MSIFSYSKLQMLNSPLTSLSTKIIKKTWVLSKGKKISVVANKKWKVPKTMELCAEATITSNT